MSSAEFFELELVWNIFMF